MLRLAAQRCVLHPKATLLLQNIINEPSQQVPLEKKKKRRSWVSVYVCTVCERARAHPRVCVKAQRDLMVREKEMERGLERGVEGWGGPLIWKVWCEWRTSGSPRWWILLHMQYGKVIHPSFSFLLSSPSFCIPSPLPQPSISSTRNYFFFFSPSSPLAHITSSFLLPGLLLLVWVNWAATQTLGQTLSSERKSQLPPAHSIHPTHFRLHSNVICWLTFHKNWNLLGKSKSLRVQQRPQLRVCVSAYIKVNYIFHSLSVLYRK